MALPGDLTTFALAFGPYTDGQGVAALTGATAKLYPVDPSNNRRVPLTHAATGQVIVPQDVTVTVLDDGTATVTGLPHTGQAGLSPSGWAWRVEWNLSSSNPSHPKNRTFVVPSGSSADYDLLAPALTVPTIALSYPTVLSVAGESGTVTAEELAEALGDAGGVTPAGGAGGALSGSYPNPGLNTAAVDTSVAANINDEDSVTAVALRAAFGALQTVAATVSASGVLVVSKHNPVNASGAARTMTLPTGQAHGTQVSVEKTDSSTNAVSITGHVRGVAATTVTLLGQNETVLMRADSSGSWWPVSGHRTKASLDAIYLAPGTDLTARVADLTIVTAPSLRVREDVVPDLVITNFQAGHGWTTGGGANWNLNNPVGAAIGTQAVTGSTTGDGVTASLVSPALSAMDFSGVKQFGLWVKVSDITKLQQIRVVAGSYPTDNAYEYAPVVNGSSHPLQSNEWALLRFTRAQLRTTYGTPPALTNITGLKVMFNDKGTGPFDFAVNRLAIFNNTEYPNGVVTFAFDDGYAATVTSGRPKLDQYGFPATSYTIVERLGTAGYVTLDDLHSLETVSGWDVAAHAYTIAGHSANFTTLSADALTYQLRNLRAFMLREGFKGADHFAYPGGVWNAATEREVRKYFSSARTLQGSPRQTYPPANRMRLGCYQPLGTDSLATITTEIAKHLDNGGHLQVMFHDLVSAVVNPVTDVLTATFNGVVDYIASRGVPVKTEYDLLYG